MTNPNSDSATTEQILQLLKARFLCRADRIAFLTDKGHPCPGQVEDQLDALLRAHLLGGQAPPVRLRYQHRQTSGVAKGPFRLGAYSPAPDGTTKWLCLDFDGGGHAGALANPRAVALETRQRFEEAGLPSYLELSGSGKGWHLWCFFDPPLSAKSARELARSLIPEEVTLATGERVPTNTGRGIEVFPKQIKIGKDGCGNLVWLPWWSEAKEAANQFHRLNAAGELIVYQPTELQTIAPEQVESILETARERILAEQEKAEREKTERLWQEWRKEALACLPLEQVYGQWLTGRRSADGWLECRDPDSPSGDRNPSAGVAEGTGQAERGQFHSFISGKTISVFDFLVERGLVSDFKAAREHVAQLSGVPFPQSSSNAASGSSSQSLPQIRIDSRQLREVVGEAWKAVHAANTPPVLFQRFGALVRLREHRHEDRVEVFIDPADEAVVYGRLTQVANWTRMGREGLLDTSPSRDAARVMLAYPDESLPALRAVVTTPLFGGDGTLIATPGYHASEQLWFQPGRGFDLPPVPDRPTPEEIAKAKSLLLDDLFVDFPFVAQADRAQAVAALLLPFVRRLIRGCTPLHVVESPSHGTGKGLLCNLVSIVATGAGADNMTLPTQEDETRKLITAELSKGRPLILLDNAKERKLLECSALAAVLTTESWTDRILGQTAMTTLPNQALWLLTGNNPRLSKDLVRRSIRIRMDARMEQAWLREEFKHKEIVAWAEEHRAELVHAVLVLVQAWLAAGRPLHLKRLGGFERWSAVIGGILGIADIPGFLENLGELYEAADGESDEWRGFVGAWWERFGSEPRRVADLQALCEELDLMLRTRGDGSSRSQQIRLGLALQAARDRVFEGKRIVESRDPRGRHRLYGLESGAGEDPEISDSTPHAECLGQHSAQHSAATKQGDSLLYCDMPNVPNVKPTPRAHAPARDIDKKPIDGYSARAQARGLADAQTSGTFGIRQTFGSPAAPFPPEGEAMSPPRFQEPPGNGRASPGSSPDRERRWQELQDKWQTTGRVDLADLTDDLFEPEETSAISEEASHDGRV
jgi:hypothetical protein